MHAVPIARRRLAAVSAFAVAVLACAGCATTEPGWTGSGATPFGTAEAECRARATVAPEGEDRDAAFVACMAEHGWARSGA